MSQFLSGETTEIIQEKNILHDIQPFPSVPMANTSLYISSNLNTVTVESVNELKKQLEDDEAQRKLALSQKKPKSRGGKK
jgi:hypothetical protein